MNKQIQLTVYLFIVTLICGVVLFKMNEATMPLISTQAEKEQNIALKKVLPEAMNFNLKEQNVFEGLSKANKLCGYIFKVNSDGYGGKIEMLVGIANNKITGISILSHSETPGLGAKANEPAFQQQFIAKTIEDAFIAKKDVTAITGSTITSQAVANGIKKAIVNYKQLTLKKESSS